MQVNAFDCLLLEFVYGNRPDDAQKVRQHVLDIISSDPGLQQTELVFLGLFGRACRVLESPESEVSVLIVLSWHDSNRAVSGVPLDSPPQGPFTLGPCLMHAWLIQEFPILCCIYLGHNMVASPSKSAP